MWGLLDPDLLVGEGGYYLTTLSSAVHVIKTLHLANDPQLANDTRLPCMEDIQGSRWFFWCASSSSCFTVSSQRTVE